MLVLETKNYHFELDEHLKTVNIAMIREVELTIRCMCSYISVDTADKVASKVSQFLKRFERLPKGQNKLDVFKCWLPYDESISLRVVQAAGIFSRPLTLYLNTIFDFNDHCKFFGNIRRIYARKVWSFSRIEPKLLENTNVIDFGILKDNEIQRPRDEIAIAWEIAHLRFVKNLKPYRPDLAYVLRHNRDILNRYHSVCTLMMLARTVKPLHLINKDCMRLILSHVRMSDWVVTKTRRNSKYASDLICLEEERRGNLKRRKVVRQETKVEMKKVIKKLAKIY